VTDSGGVRPGDQVWDLPVVQRVGREVEQLGAQLGQLADSVGALSVPAADGTDDGAVSRAAMEFLAIVQEKLGDKSGRLLGLGEAVQKGTVVVAEDDDRNRRMVLDSVGIDGPGPGPGSWSGPGSARPVE
jgi:hypothetical protein